jgi:3-isopropylmalate/(R)-2-methylmalate dehydratase small subunit
VSRLFDEVRAFQGYKLRIDLPEQAVITPEGRKLGFDIEPFRKHCLVNGLDDIALTLQKADKIRAFEAEHLARYPWLEGRPVA